MDTLPETNILPPENGWLEDDPSLLGCPIFRGELLVSGRVQLKQEGSSLPIDFLSVSFIYIEVLELLKII